jgi:hypothetical protein
MQLENNFEIDCNFESQNLCETNCKSKPQEYENCWLNMTGSDILSDISVHKLSQILLGECIDSKNTYIGIAINSVSV